MTKVDLENATLPDLLKSLTLKSWLLVVAFISATFVLGASFGAKDWLAVAFTPASATEARRLECIQANVDIMNQQLVGLRITASVTDDTIFQDNKEIGQRSLLVGVQKVQKVIDFIGGYASGERTDCNI